MIIKTLEELRQVDERSRAFTPLGLTDHANISPEKAVELHQKAVSDADLVDAVAPGTRESFERLRTVHSYGALCYELFTDSAERARLVAEQALRDRFLQHHEGEVDFVDAQGNQHQVEVALYEDLENEIRRKNWRLCLPDGSTMPFKGMLTDLTIWAEKLGLLPGQRARVIRKLQRKSRNAVAHPSLPTLNLPTESARLIHELAEFINCLWGTRTPGGRLYPGPLRREIVAVVMGDGMLRIVSADALDERSAADECECTLVRAVVAPGFDLFDFDPSFETTALPVDLLWGPGPVSDAVSWFAHNQPIGDEIDSLDRQFLVRCHEEQVDWPRRPEVFAGLSNDERTGEWHLVVADHPAHARTHVEQVHAGGKCQPIGPCGDCPATTLERGDWNDMARALQALKT